MPTVDPGDDLILEKNKLVQEGAWLWLLKFDMSLTETVYLASNSSDVTFDSKTWRAFPFTVSNITETSDGELPSFRIQVADLTGEYRKVVKANNDFGDKIVTIYKVPEVLLGTPLDSGSRRNYVSYQSGVSNTAYSRDFISFDVSPKSIINVAGPQGRIIRGSCPYVFKSATRCQYAGAGTFCDKSLDGPQGCLFYGNEINYGGFPGAIA